MLRSIALLLLICQVATAQDTRPTDEFVDNLLEGAPPRPEAKPSAALENKASPVVAKDEDWQPKLAITLTTSPQGAHAMREMTKRVPTYVTVYEDKEILRGKQTVKVKVAVQKLTLIEVKQSIASPGSAQVLCDELNLKMEASEFGPSYSFECSGRLILQTTGSSIMAESASYSDGKLKLTNAKVQQAGMAMEAESLTIAMTVFGVSTVNSPEPDRDQDRGFIPNRPEPDRLFHQNDVNDFRAYDVPAPRSPSRDRRDDWNPVDQSDSKAKKAAAESPRLNQPTDFLGR